MDDYYEILGVSKDATPDEIKKAYRKLVKQYHPDSNGNSYNTDFFFRKIQEAYEVLSDPRKRAEYDQMNSKENQQKRQKEFEDVFEETVQQAYNKGRQDQAESDFYKPQKVVFVKDDKPGCATGCAFFLLFLTFILIIAVIGASRFVKSQSANNTFVNENSIESTESDTVYATEFNQITDDMKNELFDNASEVFTYSLSHGETINSIDFDGIYFLVPKDGTYDDWGNTVYNYIFIVLHVNTTNEPGQTYEETFDYYWYVRYQNIVVNDDGSNEIYQITDISVPNNLFNPSNHWLNLYLDGGFYSRQNLYDNVIRSEGQYFYIENSFSDESVNEEINDTEEDNTQSE